MKRYLVFLIFNILLINIGDIFSSPTDKCTFNLFAKELSVSTSSLTLSSLAGASKTFIITSNLLWEINSNQPWLTTNTTGGSGDATITVTASANSTTISRVGVITVSAPGVTSKTVTVTQSGITTSIEELTSEQIVTVFPNPSRGKFNLNLNNFHHEDVSISIVNSLGNVIKKKKLENLPSTFIMEIDLSNMAGGLYFINLQTKKTNVIKSIILLK